MLLEEIQKSDIEPALQAIETYIETCRETVQASTDRRSRNKSEVKRVEEAYNRVKQAVSDMILTAYSRGVHDREVNDGSQQDVFDNEFVDLTQNQLWASHTHEEILREAARNMGVDWDSLPWEDDRLEKG